MTPSLVVLSSPPTDDPDTVGAASCAQVSVIDTGGGAYLRVLAASASGIAAIRPYRYHAGIGASKFFADRPGTVRAAGATVAGDLLYTGLVPGATIRQVVAGMGTVLSISVATDAVTVNLATDGGGAVSSAANDVIAFFNGSDANAIIARTKLSIAAATSGTGLTAAKAATAVSKGEVTIVARQTGVRVKVVVAGVSTTASIVASGLDVTVNLATDGDGVKTTTATQFVALTNGFKNLITTAVVDTGSGLVSDTGTSFVRSSGTWFPANGDGASAGQAPLTVDASKFGGTAEAFFAAAQGSDYWCLVQESGAGSVASAYLSSK